LEDGTKAWCAIWDPAGTRLINLADAEILTRLLHLKN
jgi:hypothetical protein